MGRQATTVRAASPSAPKSGTIYLADTGNHKIRRFSPDGVEELAWGGLGKEPGQFTEPVGIAVDADGRVYVVDNGNARLQMFDADGHALGALPGRGLAAEGVLRAARHRRPRRHHLGHRAGRAAGARLRPHRQGAEGDQGRRRPGLPFDRPMGIEYDSRNDTLVIADLENRLVRVPAK